MSEHFNSKNNPWTKITERTVYDNPWIRVEHHDVITPGKSEGIYGKVHYKHLAIGIIPLDENLNTYLVGQYRYPLDDYTWEIPEGGGALNELPLDAAKRELHEETGIVAQHWEPLVTLQLSNSVSDEIAYIFTAKDLTFEQSHPEETEKLTIKKVPFNQAFKMTMNGQITDSMSVAGILKLKHLLDGNS